MNNDLKPLIGKLTIFAKNRMGFSHPPKLFLKKDVANSHKMLGRTAHYDPQQQAITLYVSGRHPKDILRSYAHELVHHVQNLRGDLNPEKMGAMGNNYAQDNDHMRNREKEAYLKGNMCFRDFEDGLEDEDRKMYKLAESKIIKENKTMTTKITKKFLKETIQKILLETIEEQELEIGPGLPDTIKPDLEFGPGSADTMAPDLEIKKAIDKQLDKGLSMKELMAIIQAILNEKDPVAGKVDESNCGKREDECLDENCPTHGAVKEEAEMFAPSHYCIHHGGVHHEGKIVHAEAIGHNFNFDLNEVTHYDMRLENGTILENVAAEDIQVTDASLALEHSGHSMKREDEDEDLEEAAKPDFPDVDGDGDRKEPISKAQKDKKEKEGDKKDKKESDDEEEKSDKDLSKVPPQLRKHVKGKMNESKIQTPEQENALYEQRFTPKNNRLFEKLVKEWTK